MQGLFIILGMAKDGRDVMKAYRPNIETLTKRTVNCGRDIICLELYLYHRDIM
jgi:hypothetical protein